MNCFREGVMLTPTPTLTPTLTLIDLLASSRLCLWRFFHYLSYSDLSRYLDHVLAHPRSMASASLTPTAPVYALAESFIFWKTDSLRPQFSYSELRDLSFDTGLVSEGAGNGLCGRGGRMEFGVCRFD